METQQDNDALIPEDTLPGGFRTQEMLLNMDPPAGTCLDSSYTVQGVDTIVPCGCLCSWLPSSS